MLIYRLDRTMKTYTGRRNANGGYVVHVIDGQGESRWLDRRLDLMNYSPTGFSWGYQGSGPAQLALAILADTLCNQNDDLAVRLHQRFKAKVIAGLDRDKAWTIKEQQVLDFIVKECAPQT